MSLYNGPPRPGARGGRDQFNWENVKSDKDREFYLGHSVKASVGRWQKGKDILWYTREKHDGGDAAQQSELATVKAREEELMLEALGLKPKSARPQSQPKLDQREMKQLLEGNGDEEEEADTSVADADRIKGIGYTAGQIVGAGEAEREVMAGVGMSMPPSHPAQQGHVGGSGPPALPLPPNLSSKELKKLRKAQKKEQKAERKAKKKAKKEAKAAKKAKKAAKREAVPGEKRARHDSDSDSPSSESESESDGSPPPVKKARRGSEERAEVSHRDHGHQARERDGHGGSERERQRSDRHDRHRSTDRRRGSEANNDSRSPPRHRHHRRKWSPDRRDRRR